MKRFAFVFLFLLVTPPALADMKAKDEGLEKDAWARSLVITHASVNGKEVAVCVYNYGLGPRDNPTDTRTLACTRPDRARCPSLEDCFTRAKAEKTAAEPAFIDSPRKDADRVRRGSSISCAYENESSPIAIVIGDPRNTICATSTVCRSEEDQARIALTRSSCSTLRNGRRYRSTSPPGEFVVCPRIAHCESEDRRLRIEEVELRDNGPLLAGPGH